MFKVTLYFLLFIFIAKDLLAQNCDTVYIYFERNTTSQKIQNATISKGTLGQPLNSKNPNIYSFNYKYSAIDLKTKLLVNYNINFHNLNYDDSIPFIKKILLKDAIFQETCTIKLEKINSYEKAEILLQQILGMNKIIYLVYHNMYDEYLFIYKVSPIPLAPVRGHHQF